MTGEAKPGYRRRIVVNPEHGAVTAILEDDFHHMRVTLRHDGEMVLAIEPEMLRWPWSTCPGAQARLIETFRGLPLAEVSARRDKRLNCTHLHDLAVLAAAHAHDSAELRYAIEADDPVQGEVEQRLWRNDVPLLVWRERDGQLTAPPEIAGQTLFTLREWIAGLPEPQREAARPAAMGFDRGARADDSGGAAARGQPDAAELLYLSAGADGQGATDQQPARFQHGCGNPAGRWLSSRSASCCQAALARCSTLPDLIAPAARHYGAGPSFKQATRLALLT